MAIEVDGYEYHENNPDQLKKDRLKDAIFEKIGIALLRLKTNSSGEDETIKTKLKHTI